MKYYNIAYVDDDPLFLQLLERECDGFNKASDDAHVALRTYESHEDFMKVYEEGLYEFDCVILDIHLHGLNAFDLLKSIWKREQPVIMCSSSIKEDEDLPSMMPKDKIKFSEIVDRCCTLKNDFLGNVLQLMQRKKDARYCTA